jgi:hypothetical protein
VIATLSIVGNEDQHHHDGRPFAIRETHETHVISEISDHAIWTLDVLDATPETGLLQQDRRIRTRLL